jgi:hypothetical protein
VRYIAVSPDGRLVATGSHGGTKVNVWQAADGKPEKELPVEGLSLVGFSPNGQWLATTRDGLRLWAVADWRVVSGKHCTPPNYQGRRAQQPRKNWGVRHSRDTTNWRQGPEIGGRDFAFSPDSKVLAVETGYGSVRLVDPSSGREYARLEDPNQARGEPRFSPDGSRLIVTGIEGLAVRVWDLRVLREELAKMDLDWDLPPYPPPDARADQRPLQVQVDPGDAEKQRQALADNNEAWRLATHPEAKSRDPGRAVDLAQQAVELAPKQRRYWNTLGVADYRAGNYQESITALEKSRQLQAGQFAAFDSFFLAMAHWQLGLKDEAQNWRAKVVEWVQKNQEALKKNPAHDDELRRFRAEAEELLGAKKDK